MVSTEDVQYPLPLIDYGDSGRMASRYDALRQAIDARPGDFQSLLQLLEAGLAVQDELAVVSDPDESDVIVTWAWGDRRLQYCPRPKLEDVPQDVIVLERGYLGNRFFWTSAAFNGINGLAELHNDGSPADRWDTHFASLLKPWRKNPDGYFLILGQLPGDAATAGYDLEDCYQRLYAECSAERETYFRPHPQQTSASRRSLKGINLLEGSLEDAFANAYCSVSISSNALLLSVLAGTPAIAFDPRAIVWPIAGHDLREVIYPERRQFMCDLVYRQWSPAEIADGIMWRYLTQRYRRLEPFERPINPRTP